MDASYSKIAIDSQGKMIFLGVKKSKDKGGVVRYIKNLFKGEVSELEDYLAHDERGVTNMAISYDDSYLISVGNDGVICIFIANQGDGGKLNLNNINEKYQNLELITR